MNVRLSPKAASDRLAHWQYIGQFSWDAADRIDDAILSALRLMSEHPYMGRPGRLPGTRELPIGGSKLIALYEIEGDTVRVIRLLHSAQDWPARF